MRSIGPNFETRASYLLQELSRTSQPTPPNSRQSPTAISVSFKIRSRGAWRGSQILDYSSGWHVLERARRGCGAFPAATICKRPTPVWPAAALSIWTTTRKTPGIWSVSARTRLSIHWSPSPRSTWPAAKKEGKPNNHPISSSSGVSWTGAASGPFWC